jgi:hypothetical protein
LFADLGTLGVRRGCSDRRKVNHQDTKRTKVHQGAGDASCVAALRIAREAGKRIHAAAI